MPGSPFGPTSRPGRQTRLWMRLSRLCGRRTARRTPKAPAVLFATSWQTCSIVSLTPICRNFPKTSAASPSNATSPSMSSTAPVSTRQDDSGEGAQCGLPLEIQCVCGSKTGNTLRAAHGHRLQGVRLDSRRDHSGPGDATTRTRSVPSPNIVHLSATAQAKLETNPQPLKTPSITREPKDHR